MRKPCFSNWVMVMLMLIMTTMLMPRVFGNTRNHSPVCQQEACLDSVDLAVNNLKSLEGFVPTATWDVDAYRFGYGTITRAGENTISRANAEKRLLCNVVQMRTFVRRVVTVELSANQEAALICFTYNIGKGAFRSSTLLTKLNSGKYECVPYEMRRWVNVTRDGLKCPSDGLINRREQEIALWSDDESHLYAHTAEYAASQNSSVQLE